MNRMVLLVAGAVAASGVVWAGFAYNRQTVCAGLEEDFLNAIGGMKRSALTKPLAMSMGNNGAAHEMAFNANARLMEYTLPKIANDCGDRAAEAASRKGQDLLSN